MVSNLVSRKWQQKHSIIRRPLLFCWMLALLPAIPMWVDPTHSYTDMEDNNNCVCKFPYRDVSPSFQTLVCEHYASSSECVGVVEQCCCFHSPNNSHPRWWNPHCTPLCQGFKCAQREQVSFQKSVTSNIICTFSAVFGKGGS